MTTEQTEDRVQEGDGTGTRRSPMPSDTPQHLAMLRILYGACSAALDAFRAADNPVDDQLVKDLETMMTRTHGEIERLTGRLGESP